MVYTAKGCLSHPESKIPKIYQSKSKTPKSCRFLGEASKAKHDMWGGGLRMHTKPWVRARAHRDYWEKLNPSSGRPFAASFSAPDAWGVTKGSEMLKQQADVTTSEEIEKLRAHGASQRVAA